ncbi:MAG: bifunctional phosphopantothenoylcysteine decarboxylase/phosphopantothenate--cysteine ligase CoaBC [Bacteroidetes bacterium]|nr:bifunctional phosphopantothenoylcysteine decarboxylase/phosphopantothenate--cysteine ligase CoaBC [Bacteroidota bacterium]
MQLAGKRIILGITGSIAAYKAALITRLLVLEGAEVQVIMSESAAAFISPLTLSVLSKKPVLSQMVSAEQTWNNHVELGLWADLFVVAPISANTLAAFANGTCQNLIHAVFLSARCPVMVAPAMDHDMFLHEATRANIALLKKRGVLFIDPAKGELASGIIGEGRMQEPEFILEKISSYFDSDKPLAGKKILVSAGPTREKIDPVRYISNFSTGKMGVAIARALLNAGATVYFVSGPLQIEIPSAVHLVSVTSAEEMLNACTGIFPEMDAAIMTAAVADYTPMKVNDQKVKKMEAAWNLELSKTEDILLHLGKIKKRNQLLIGFALETQNELENAQEKLTRKNLDMIVLNSMNDEGAGFGTDTNKVTLLFKDNTMKDVPLMSKDLVAKEIIDSLLNLMHA